jgi:phage recombination protein Bet
MKNALQTKEQLDNAVWQALKNSVYPGAKDESILMVVEYCKAGGLDPLQKPVHLVPMWIVDKKTGKGEMRDVVMPGIGLYRTQASRTGQYAGMTEPEFGEDVTETLGGVKITYPKWCKITIKKMINGNIIEFSAKEYWKENYATAGKDSEAPNAMWKKRPYGQLAKCSEGQALRKAFPELGSLPTAEEMEGKQFMEDVTPTKAVLPTGSFASKSDMLSSLLGGNAQPNLDASPQTQTKLAISPHEELVDQLKKLVIDQNVPFETIQMWMQKAGASSYEDFSEEQLLKCINHIVNKAQ